MAKNNKAEETHTSIDTLNDSLTSIGAKAQAHRKLIVGIVVAVIVIIVAVLAYILLVRNPAKNNANVNAGAADIELIANGNDSIAAELYKQAAKDGYDSGNRATLQAAILLYNDGKYEEALKYVSDYSPKDELIGAAAYSLKGDCQVQLDKLQDAISSYKKAISQSGKNEYYTPFFMVKLARVYEALGNNADEAATYQQIKDDYPVYIRDVNPSVDKLLERAKLRAGK